MTGLKGEGEKTKIIVISKRHNEIMNWQKQATIISFTIEDVIYHILNNFV